MTFEFRIPRREHIHLAQAGDLEPPSLPVDPFFRSLDPDEIARAERQDELLAERQRQRHDLREHEAAERAAVKATSDERFRPSGPGWDQ
jgi:hypothetical protein